MSEQTNQTPVHVEPQHVAVEIMGVMPCLRGDLHITVQSYAGQPSYVIHDTLTSKFYRLGVSEYTFVSMLDGKTTIAEAMGQNASVMGPAALSEREVGTLCKWLVESGLTTTAQSELEKRLSKVREKEQNKKLIGSLNPIMQKIPICNPMPLLRRFDWLAKGIFSRFASIVWIFVVLFAGQGIWSNWDRFIQTSTNLLSADNWIWLIVSWVGLKLLHETSHALACRRFNGNVREAGFVLIVFAPMPYVDVTSAWQMTSKWHRIVIAAAGMYAELFAGAVAAIVWSQTMDALVQQHCFNVIVTATVMTLLFNANPLMRFDGYYMLSDALEMPNLATHGRQWKSYAVRRYLAGMNVRCPQWPEGRHAFVVTYAILAFLWRILIGISLLISAEVLWHGAGIVLAMAAAFFWFMIPLGRSLGGWSQSRDKLSLPRIATIVACVTIFCYAIWFHVPCYRFAKIPIVVDYYPSTELRAGVAGFLKEANVEIGTHVEPGQEIAVLENEELEIRRDNLTLQIEQSLARQRKFRSENAIAAVQIESKSIHSLSQRLAEIQTQLNALVITASEPGVVVDSDIQSMQGSLLRAGDRLCVVGSETREIVYGLIDQNRVDAVRDLIDQEIWICLWGSGNKVFRGKVVQVFPRATTELKFPALGAHAGGPLTVQAVPQNQERKGEVELVEPHFPVLIQFDGCESVGACVGQSGYARLRYTDNTVGKVIIGKLDRWIRAKRQLVSDLTQTAQHKCSQMLRRAFF